MANNIGPKVFASFISQVFFIATRSRGYYIVAAIPYGLAMTKIRLSSSR